jgi:cholesterol oxidase
MTQHSISRRGLLTVTALGAGSAVATGALGRDQALASYGTIPNLIGKSAIVVGSGFGGAVAACRLGQAGVRTTVLERGTAGKGDISAHRGDGIDVLSGVGVGGGSLLGMSMSQPRRSEWDLAYPAELPFTEMDQIYWPRARHNLNVSPMPADIETHPDYRGSVRWREHIAAFGKTPTPVPFAVDWDALRAEFAGRSVTGRAGAWNSVDRNYLVWAAATGNVTVQPLHEVTEIRELTGRQGFEVTFRQLNEHGDVLATKTLPCDFVFLAAGAVHTTSLLVTARAKGWLPRLRSTVGKGFGNNGDFLVARFNLGRRVGLADRGPGSAMFYDDSNPYVSAAAMAFEPSLVPTWATGSMAHLITSMTPERGEIRYDAGSGTAKVYWPYGVMDTRAEKAGQDLATRLWWETEGSKGRAFRGVPSFDRSTGAGLGSASTRNPLGGMVMGQSTDFGGKSLDYPNLYCVDGSVLPGTACLASPALTITANAERCLDRFVAEHL